MAWFEAVQYCGEWGGSMVSIKDENQEKAAMDILDNKEVYWLGLRHKQELSQQMWVDGSALVYKNPSLKEPRFEEQETCLATKQSGDKNTTLWKYINCYQEKHFIC